MKSVLISIQPKWVEKIASGEKTIEVRKTRPKIETPFKVYIYQTRKPISVMFSGTGKHISEYDKTYCYNERSGKVIGEFVCDEIGYITPCYGYLDARCIGGAGYILDKCCLAAKDLIEYGKGKGLYGWHITDLKIYDNPKELSEFKSVKVIRRYQKKEYNKFEKLSHAHRVEVKYLERPPQSWCYVNV